MVIILLRHGANPNVLDNNLETPLFHVSSYGDAATVEALIAAGACVNIVNIQKFTPLHCAILGDKIEIVRVLLAHGADPCAYIRNYGCTPLCYAVKANDKDLVQLLLECGAQVNVRDADNVRPLRYAVARRYHAIADLLFEYGAVE